MLVGRLHCGLPGECKDPDRMARLINALSDIPNLRHCELKGLEGRLGNGSVRWFA
jgi:hypothetical protein